MLVNEKTPIEGVMTGGAPRSPEGFQALAAAGFRTFVDLRDDPETLVAARADAEAAGLTYESIAVGGEAELDLHSARALASILDEITRYPIAVACSSGNRAGALLAVEAFWLDGRSAESALELGERAGLTRLAPSVRILLGLPAATPPAESNAP